jgi:hypothetical protein
MGNGIEIGTIEKNSINKIRVAVNEYKGRRYIDVRTLFQGEDGAWVPTKKGVALSPDRMPELIRLLNEARTKAQELEENGRYA